MTTTTASTLCLPPGYTSRPDPAYYVDDTAVVWQPDVYERVASDPRCAGVMTILDLGCGAGDKLVKLADRFEVVGVDYGENIGRAVRRSVGRWVACDFDHGQISPSLGIDYQTTAIICADVLEHLRDPARLLQGLADAHIFYGCPLIAVSSPDRDRLYEPGHRGPPVNPCHAREWSAGEFVALFASYGMTATQTWTRSSTLGPEENTTLLMVGQ